jgi:hypothetical protein
VYWARVAPAVSRTATSIRNDHPTNALARMRYTPQDRKQNIYRTTSL